MTLSSGHSSWGCEVRSVSVVKKLQAGVPGTGMQSPVSRQTPAWSCEEELLTIGYSFLSRGPSSPLFWAEFIFLLAQQREEIQPGQTTPWRLFYKEYWNCYDFFIIMHISNIKLNSDQVSKELFSQQNVSCWGGQCSWDQQQGVPRECFMEMGRVCTCGNEELLSHVEGKAILLFPLVISPFIL